MLHHFRYQSAAILALLLAGTLFFAGCAGMGGGGERELPTDKLTVAAAEAWNAKDFAKSELFYSRLVQRSDMSDADRLTALKRLAYSSSVLGHYHQSQAALEAWAKADPSSEKDWRWQKLYADALIGLGDGDKAKQHLAILRIRKDMPEKVRLNAGLQLAALYRKERNNDKSLDTLAVLYADTTSDESKVFLEDRLISDLERLPLADLDTLAGFVTPANRNTYPYSLVLFERAIKMVEADPAKLSAAWPVLRAVAAGGKLRSVERLNRTLAKLEQRFGAPQTGLALALPLSGRYARVGWKILRGAGAAQWEIAQGGTALDVAVVNTAGPDWTAELANLPMGYSVLGGPLRREALAQALAAGVLDRHVTFAFLSDLGDVAEGSKAWRFFGSPHDQVGAMIDFCSGVGIDTFGVIGPDEEYGRRMTRVFEQEAARRGAKVLRTQTYPPSNHPAWGEAVRTFLNVDKGVGADNPFKAVFVPDSLTQAGLLIPHFFFYEENRLLILGPSMWHQALSEGTEIEKKYFDAAIFSDGWKADSPGARKLASVLREQGLGEPDYWTALGYDFVRFAARLGEFKSVVPAEVNVRLQSAADMEFSLAPMTWSNQGVAGQKVWVFGTDRYGKPVPADSAELLKRIEAAEAFRKQRIEVIEEDQRR